MIRLLWLGLFIALVAAAGWVIKSRNPDYAIDAGAADRDFGLVALPDGSTLVAAEGTVTHDLITWLESADPQPRWFELGGQQFVGKSVEPAGEAAGRVPRLIRMLRAYPDVTVHVVGYTDPTGDPVANQKLSEDRAKTLVRLLERGGISEIRLSAEGRGSADPIGDNSTPEGRARNQRVALRLTRR